MKYLFIEDYRNVVLYAGKIRFNQVAQRAIDRDRNQVDLFQLVNYRGLNLFVKDFIGLQIAGLILLDFMDQIAKECVQDRIGNHIPVGLQDHVDGIVECFSRLTRFARLQQVRPFVIAELRDTHQVHYLDWNARPVKS